MTLRIGVEVGGLERAERMILEAKAAARDLRPAFMQINSHHVEPFFRERFETGGAHGGRAWRPLAASTRRSRALARGGPAFLRSSRRALATRADFPLWATGRLKRSLQAPGPDSITIIDRQRYERGTRVPYAHFHQEGRGVPKREIIPEHLPAFLVRQIEDEIVKHFEGG